MLPPGASAPAPTESSAQSPASEKKPDRPIPVSAKSAETPEGVVLLPTEDGGFQAVRESTKTVVFEGEEVELRRLSPDEKRRKRFVRNIFMAVFGVLFLVAVAIVLILIGS